ncbi:MAG: ROK family protein [Acidimicrobiia bacterium]|nr:ROK family protein [Acidimicrobiia bacterium]
MRVGIDLGGTKIEGVLFGRGGEELARRRIATPRDYPATVRAIVETAEQLDAAAGTRATIGVGIPGAWSPVSRLVKNANATWLNGRPLLQDLHARLGPRVRMANDANCFALSEATDGAAAGAAVVFGVILGTGVGGGIVARGEVLTGPNAIAGEWGHNPVPWPTADEWPGPACYCGRSGCIETFLSGPGLAADLARSAPGAMEPAAIVARADEGDAVASAALARYEDRLARGLASVVNLLDPDVIVLGGGLSNVDRWYERVPRVWDRYIFSDTVRTRLVKARYGDASGVRGAAWLWPAGRQG